MKGVEIPKLGSGLVTGATPDEVLHWAELLSHQVTVYLSRDWSVLGVEGGAQFTTTPVWEEDDEITEATGPETPSVEGGGAMEYEILIGAYL